MGLFGPSKAKQQEVQRDIQATLKRIETKRGNAIKASQRAIDSASKKSGR